MHLLKFLPGMVVFLLCLGCSFAWGQVEVRSDNSVKILSNNNNDNTLQILEGSIWVNQNRAVKIGQDGNKMWLGWGEISMKTDKIKFNHTSGGLMGYQDLGLTMNFNTKNEDCFSDRTGQQICVQAYWDAFVPEGVAAIGTSDNAFAEIHGKEVHANNFITTSDGQYKTEIDSLNGESSISIIQALNPVKYQFNDAYWNDYGYDSVQVFPDEKKNRDRWGFIAQEVNQVMPELANPIDSTGTLGLNQSELVPILTNGIQRQQSQIENLQQQIENLQQQLNDLQEQLNSCNCGESTE